MQTGRTGCADACRPDLYDRATKPVYAKSNVHNKHSLPIFFTASGRRLCGMALNKGVQVGEDRNCEDEVHASLIGSNNLAPTKIAKNSVELHFSF